MTKVFLADVFKRHSWHGNLGPTGWFDQLEAAPLENVAQRLSDGFTRQPLWPSAVAGVRLLPPIGDWCDRRFWPSTLTAGVCQADLAYCWAETSEELDHYLLLFLALGAAAAGRAARQTPVRIAVAGPPESEALLRSGLMQDFEIILGANDPVDGLRIALR